MQPANPESRRGTSTGSGTRPATSTGGISASATDTHGHGAGAAFEGWYDAFLAGGVRTSPDGRRRRRTRQPATTNGLVIGPWDHSTGAETIPNPRPC